MWDFLKDHQSELQSLAPISTMIAATIAAIVATTIARMQYAITKSQRDIAKEKLKSDLFERRYKAYDAIKQLAYDLKPNSMKMINYHVWPEWQNAASEIPFLFSGEAVEIADKILQVSYEWERNIEESQGGDVTDEQKKHFDKRRVELPEEMGRLYLKLHDAFMPHLSFTLDP